MDKTDVAQLHLFLERGGAGELRVRIVATSDARSFKKMISVERTGMRGPSAPIGEGRGALLEELKAALLADPVSLELARAIGFVGLSLHGDMRQRHELLRLLAGVDPIFDTSSSLPGSASEFGEVLVWPLDALGLDGDSRESVRPRRPFDLPSASRLPDFGGSPGHDMLRGDSKESGRGDSNES